MDTTGTPALSKALAAFQADLPPIAKGETANTGTYSYDYADLTAVSLVALPLLGKHGLAFTTMPTLTGEGRFVLSYSLLHSSGEERTGQYPLPDKGTSQQLGSAITYARRYCLLAVTGIAPGGEDDDGAAAGHAQHSDDWRKQPPVNRPRSNGHAPRTADDFAEWALQHALALKDSTTARELWHEVSEAAKGGGITEKQRDDLHELITAQVEDLKREPPKITTATVPEGDTWQADISAMSTREDALALLDKLETARKGGLVDGRRYAALKAAIRTKANSLPGGVPA